MAETDHTQLNIAALRADVEYIRNLVTLDIAANPQSREYVEELLRERKGSAELYLALAAGPKSQEALAKNIGWSQPNVSRVATHLMQYGLIRKVPDPHRKGAWLYLWSDAERVLKVSKIARKLVK